MMSVLLRRFFSKEPHKRLPISKTISKNFLDKFLDRAMLYGIRVFGGSNIKTPKTLVNTGVSASFIICYRPLKFSNFWVPDVPWKPFEGNLTWVRISHPPPPKSLENTTFSRLFSFSRFWFYAVFLPDFLHFLAIFRKIKSPENPCYIRLFGTLV